MQAPDVAVIIPTLNEEARIGALLTELKSQAFNEIIVADGGSADATVEIAARIPGVNVARAQRGRGHQINAGVASARSALVLVLHADTWPPATAADEIRRTLASAGVACGSFTLRFDNTSRWLSAYAWLTRFDSSLTTFGDQGYFFRRADFFAVGGAPGWPFLEDVELRSRFRRLGRFVKVQKPVVTSARRFESRGYIAGQLRNATVLAGYRLGVPVERLARFYGFDRNE